MHVLRVSMAPVESVELDLMCNESRAPELRGLSFDPTTSSASCLELQFLDGADEVARAGVRGHAHQCAQVCEDDVHMARRGPAAL